MTEGSTTDPGDEPPPRPRPPTRKTPWATVVGGFAELYIGDVESVLSRDGSPLGIITDVLSPSPDEGGQRLRLTSAVCWAQHAAAAAGTASGTESDDEYVTDEDYTFTRGGFQARALCDVPPAAARARCRAPSRVWTHSAAIVGPPPHPPHGTHWMVG